MIIILSSCGRTESGELTGVLDRPSWSGINPYGMVYVPSGTLIMGQSDQDIFSTYTQMPKSVSVHGFFMDDTEITNNEYRQFVYWVRDSIAHTIMGDFYEDDYGNERIDWEYELDYSDETLAALRHHHPAIHSRYALARAARPATDRVRRPYRSAPAAPVQN